MGGEERAPCACAGTGMKIHFYAGKKPKAREAFEELAARYGQALEKDCDVIAVIGGDGTMLDALHEYGNLGKPFYGMNLGSVGFLLNPDHRDDLPAFIEKSSAVTIHPLRMEAADRQGNRHEALAFNEVSLLRETRQTAHLKISVDGIERIPELVCDGVMLATPAGSTAYNLSAHGPILPLSSNTLALTPISAFRPRRWRGALIPSHLHVRIDVLNPENRPVSATADSQEFRDVVSVDIHQSTSIGETLLFDPDHHLEERILKEQFLA
jgi:NAD+ kinase